MSSLGDAVGRPLRCCFCVGVWLELYAISRPLASGHNGAGVRRRRDYELDEALQMLVPAAE